MVRQSKVNYQDIIEQTPVPFQAQRPELLIWRAPTVALASNISTAELGQMLFSDWCSELLSIFCLLTHTSHRVFSQAKGLL